MRRYVTVALLLACMVSMAMAVVPTKPRAKTGAPSCVSPIVSLSCNLDSRSGYVFGLNYRTLAEVTNLAAQTGNPDPSRADPPATPAGTQRSPKLRSGNFRVAAANLPERLVCASGNYNPTNAQKNSVNVNPQQRLVFGLTSDGSVANNPNAVQMADKNNGGWPVVDRNIDGGTGLPSYLISRVQLWNSRAPEGRGKVALIKFQLTNYFDREVIGDMVCGRPINRADLDEANPDEEWDGDDVLGDGVPRYLSGFQGSCYKRNLFNNVNDPQYYLTALKKLCWVPKPATRLITGTPNVWYPAGTPYWDPTPLQQVPPPVNTPVLNEGLQPFPAAWVGRPIGITVPTTLTSPHTPVPPATEPTIIANPRLVCGTQPGDRPAITSTHDWDLYARSFADAAGNRRYCPLVPLP